MTCENERIAACPGFPEAVRYRNVASIEIKEALLELRLLEREWSEISLGSKARAKK